VTIWCISTVPVVHGHILVEVEGLYVFHVLGEGVDRLYHEESYHPVHHKDEDAKEHRHHGQEDQYGAQGRIAYLPGAYQGDYGQAGLLVVERPGYARPAVEPEAHGG
jgi:hypothetical protein